MVAVVKRAWLRQQQHWLCIRAIHCLRAQMVVGVRFRQMMWFFYFGNVGTAQTEYEEMAKELSLDTCVAVAWICVENVDVGREE